MLYVFGIGEVPLSISGDPGSPETLMHTVRAVGAVTKAIAALDEGDRVGITRPLWDGMAHAGDRGQGRRRGGGRHRARPGATRRPRPTRRAQPVRRGFAHLRLADPSDLLYLEELRNGAAASTSRSR